MILELRDPRGSPLEASMFISYMKTCKLKHVKGFAQGHVGNREGSWGQDQESTFSALVPFPLLYVDPCLLRECSERPQTTPPP